MKKTLLVMAAGLGSRYGGMKQLEPVGPNGEFIIDYAVYDALEAGFNKVVFVIKKDYLKEFKDTIGKRISESVEVVYVFQETDQIPINVKLKEKREKPWGTGHAVLAAKDVVKEPFAIINADDFYGKDAFKQISEHLDSVNIHQYQYALAGYKLINTLSENGSVKRGLCRVKNDYLEDIVESLVETEVDGLHATPLQGNKIKIKVENDTITSLNLFAVTPEIFEYIEKSFEQFLKNPIIDLQKDELHIPKIFDCMVNEGLATVKIVDTTSKWLGITYREDRKSLVEYINKEIKKGNYKKELWK